VDVLPAPFADDGAETDQVMVPGNEVATDREGLNRGE
jgi:hypothetical protein